MTIFFPRIFYILFLLFIFASCNQKKPAKIVLNGNSKYNRQSSFKNKYQNLQQNKTSKSASVTVENNDTVYSIAQKNQVSIKELIKENHLSAPYNLKKGSKINLPQNKYHQVESGETLYSISRTYNMNINNLIKINDLQEPYNIKTGQKLKITGNSQIAKAEIPENTKEKVVSINKKPQQKIISESQKQEEKELAKPAKFMWPVSGRIISKFGSKSGGLYNDGVNIKANAGTKVKAAEDGTVAYVGNELRGYGNLIIIKHSGHWISAYAHLEKYEVKKGDKVKKGTIIAKVGSSGNVDSPQLYFGIRKGRQAVNPEDYIKSKTAKK